MKEREGEGEKRQRKIEMMCASLEVKYYVRTAPIFISRYKTARPSWGKSEKHAISLIGFRVHAGVRKITSYVIFIYTCRGGSRIEFRGVLIYRAR